jgi:hypothetical protein
MRRNLLLALSVSSMLACSDDGAGRTELGDGDGIPETGDASGDGDPGDGDPGDGDPGDGDPGDGDGDSGDGDPGDGDGDGDSGDGDGDGPCQPNPESCDPGLVCDVISGECVAPDSPCTLSGASTQCGAVECGPGSVCDDEGACIPVAPCAAVSCEGEQCWGIACVCERPIGCATATAEQLNGPFATDIFDLEFSDDCDAWMVTLRSGPDYLRRMTPGGVMTEWESVANLNMGEVKVLKVLTPQAPPPPGDVGDITPSSGLPQTVGGGTLGEVAITYTCCPTCGCFVDPPQGVARLLEGEPVPLPIVLPAVATQGTQGPFFNVPADAGPMGLTWGEDLRLYVGNSQANGNYDTVDLLGETQDFLLAFESRVTAAAPLTAVHLLIALDTGELLRFNTKTHQATPVYDFEVGVTGLSHDSFTGLVYASLSDLSVVAVDPFSAEITDFETMPNLGRVAVSPDGKLWFVPARFVVGNLSLIHWDLPGGF